MNTRNVHVNGHEPERTEPVQSEEEVAEGVKQTTDAIASLATQYTSAEEASTAAGEATMKFPKAEAPAVLHAALERVDPNNMVEHELVVRIMKSGRVAIAMPFSQPQVCTYLMFIAEQMFRGEWTKQIHGAMLEAQRAAAKLDLSTNVAAAKQGRKFFDRFRKNHQ